MFCIFLVQPDLWTKVSRVSHKECKRGIFYEKGFRSCWRWYYLNEKSRINKVKKNLWILLHLLGLQCVRQEGLYLFSVVEKTNDVSVAKGVVDGPGKPDRTTRPDRQTNFSHPRPRPSLFTPFTFPFVGTLSPVPKGRNTRVPRGRVPEKVSRVKHVWIEDLRFLRFPWLLWGVVSLETGMYINYT